MPRTPVQGLAFLLGFVCALYLSPLTVGVSRANEGPSAFAGVESSLLAEVNAVRTNHHLIPLRRDPALDRVALAHSLDMASRDFLAHVSPEGANPVDRIHGAGVAGFTLAGENLGKTGVHNAPHQELVRAWLASPEHRDNLLAPPFNATGIGIARASDGTLICTQVYVTYPR